MPPTPLLHLALLAEECLMNSDRNLGGPALYQTLSMVLRMQNLEVPSPL